VTLRDLADLKGKALVDRVIEIVDRLRPLHLSIVGGDPLVRYRELIVLMPMLLERGVHVQVVTSAFREIPREWAGLSRLTIAVSIDGLQAEHDARRAPATYPRILQNIAGQKITIHCTITGQMMKRPGYLEEFLDFWTPRPEIARVWFSMFTPQIGDDLPEMLTREERLRAVSELLQLRKRYPKLGMPEVMLREFLTPPKSPKDCVFAATTTSISADLSTRITPCQFGGNPDCSSCGCIASMGLAAVGNYRLGGVLPVGSLLKASIAVGKLRARKPVPLQRPAVIQIQPSNRAKPKSAA
jgi:MoaA/NifB/PqqE/SkfB family radical SAM enzyme